MDINESVNDASIFDNRIEMRTGLLTIEELARFLKVKVKTLYNMVYRKNIPFIKVGRLLRFEQRAIEVWLSERSSHIVY